MTESLENLEIPVDPVIAPRRGLHRVPWGNSVFALFDQGLVSCGNFLTNVLLARSLAADQYGKYALMLDAILFLNSLQSALLIYPLLVRCPSMDEEKVRTFAGTCVALTLLMAIPLGGMVFMYGTLVGTAKIAFWAVLGQTLWQCQETLRRTMHARGTYSKALPGDIISYLGQASLIGLLALTGKASVSLAFMAIAITSFTACVVQAFQLRVKIASFAKAAKMSLSFWRMGRWVLISNLSTLVSSVCCSYSLAMSHGAAAMGRFAAISNLMRPSNPILIALSTLIVPAVALAASKHGPNDLFEAIRVTRKHTLRCLAVLAPYWLILLLVPNQAIKFLYPHRPEYQQLGLELQLFVASYFMTMVTVVVASMLNGFNRSRRALAGQLVGTGASAAITIPLTIHLGLRGLLLGTLISNTVIAVALVYLLVRLKRYLSQQDQRDNGIVPAV